MRGLQLNAGPFDTMHQRNPAVSTRYANAKKSDAEIIDLVVDLLGSSTGGPQEYKGLDMKVAHTGMNCSEAEFVAVLDDLLAALSKQEVGDLEKTEILALNYGLKDEIVHVQELDPRRVNRRRKEIRRISQLAVVDGQRSRLQLKPDRRKYGGTR